MLPYLSANELSPEELEINALNQKIQNKNIITKFSPTSGTLVLSREQAVTIDDLRTIEDVKKFVLDEELDNFIFRGPDYYSQFTHPAETSETPEQGSAYEAEGIRPFQFKYFNVDVWGGGYYSNALIDYSAAHGMNRINPYVRDTSDKSYLPPNTEFFSQITQVNFFGTESTLPGYDYFYAHGIGPLRYDLFYDHVQQVGEQQVINTLAEQINKVVPYDPNKDSYFILDMEHSGPEPKTIVKKEWYPTYPSETIDETFNAKYYKGLELTYTLSVKAARKNGWPSVGFYGWAPQEKYFGLSADPYEWHWNLFGPAVYNEVDFLLPSVYCPYWKPDCVAFTLAIIDNNLKIINTQITKKPLRPYYWFRTFTPAREYWQDLQPRPVEEARALILMSFFTGIDGPEIFAWSGGENFNLPPKIEAGKFVMVGTPFSLSPVEGDLYFYVGANDKNNIPILVPYQEYPFEFERYDVLYLEEIRDGEVTFKRVDQSPYSYLWNYGLNPGNARFKMKESELQGHLRPSYDALKGFFEGLALAKPLEYSLRHGEVKIDVPAIEQFNYDGQDLTSTKPIVRRIKIGKYHLIATYDGLELFYGRKLNLEPVNPLKVNFNHISRNIILENFDGIEGLTLELPADAETRIFILEEISQGDTTQTIGQGIDEMLGDEYKNKNTYDIQIIAKIAYYLKQRFGSD